MCTLCYCRTHLQRGNRWRNCVGEVRRASTFAAGKKNSWHGKNTMSKYCKPAMLRNSRRCKLPPPSLRLCSRSLCLHSPPRWCNSAHSSGQETAGKDPVITVQKTKSFRFMWIVPVSSPISGLCKICCRSGLLWMCTLCYCRTHLQREIDGATVPTQPGRIVQVGKDPVIIVLPYTVQ